MYSADFETQRGFSPLADNVIMLRYAPVDSAVVSSLMVVKTRGSAHDKGLYVFDVGRGGLRLGAPLKISGQADYLPVDLAGKGSKPGGYTAQA